MASTLAAPAGDGSALSLLSLSIAAASAAPIPVPGALASNTGVNGQTGSLGGFVSASAGGGAKQLRRLASTGKARRRLSDARDAASRPSPAVPQTTAAALSLASLSLSSSAVSAGKGSPYAPTVTIPAGEASTLAAPDGVSNERNVSSSVPLDNGASIPPPPSASVTKSGKKRGTDHKCESCSKIYRHPSCLIKHRWEHTPHWREASKFVLSKHQQVQLLEAAAILSHLSPSSSTGTSLPEDRSLWPSFLSGGSLPKAPTEGPTSSSVPAHTVLGSGRATSTGPRLHDYAIPASASSVGITQLRPGLLGVPVGSAPTHGTLPVAVPVTNAATRGTSAASASATSESWGSPASSYYRPRPVQSPTVPGSLARSASGWSLPRSSLRSVSASSYSRSRSGSSGPSNEDDGFVHVDIEVDDDGAHAAKIYGFSARGRVWKREDDELSVAFSVREEDEELGEPAKARDEEWDGMEMEMEMD